jgi:hypothetical protein
MKVEAFNRYGRTETRRRYVVVKPYVSRLVILARTDNRDKAIRYAGTHHNATRGSVAVIDRTIGENGTVIFEQEAV